MFKSRIKYDSKTNIYVSRKRREYSSKIKCALTEQDFCFLSNVRESDRIDSNLIKF